MTRTRLIAAMLAVPMIALSSAAYAGASSWAPVKSPASADRDVGMAQSYSEPATHSGGWDCRYQGGPKSPISHFRR
jgi:hypothetical protein